MSYINDFEHLKIQLKDIQFATNNFGDKPIGIGGFGKVYKGELSLLPEGKKVLVAFKRLDRKFGQGDTEFWKEIMMLSQYKHENLISLLGFCSEKAERILVYEYASRGSLDHYLDKSSLTWTQRLRICHGAACGLNYLHDPMGMHQIVLHRDVKSSNILLDKDFTAKISDFGLSKFGPANQQYTYIISNVVGTHGYCDPAYMEMGYLSKESDVYSFGVVLFEVMCGKLCFECRKNELNIFVHEWKRCYEENRIHDMISSNLKKELEMDMDMDMYSFKTFACIAYQCLHRDRKERPTMEEIIQELVKAISHQECLSIDVADRAEYKEMLSIAKHNITPITGRSTPIIARSKTELELVLSKGIFVVDAGEHRLVRNKNGEYCELVSGYQCLPPQARGHRPQFAINTGLFYDGKGFPCISMSSPNDLVANPRFLSANVTYSINLLYRYYNSEKGEYVPLKYKLQGETNYWTSYVAQRRGEWLVTELYQFTSCRKEHDFRFVIIGRLHPDHFHAHDDDIGLFLVGIEFLPVEHEKNEHKVDMPLNMDLEKILPSDCAEIIKWSNYTE